VSTASGAPPTSRSVRVRAAVVACLTLLAVAAGVATAAPAVAHATLLSSDPAEGEVLASTPDTVTFTFDEPVSLAADAVQVFDAVGEPVESVASSRDVVVTTDLPDELPDGTYVVVWRAVSADGHPIAGSLSFSIGAPSLEVAAPEVPEVRVEPVRSLLSAVQAIGYVGLLAAGGLVLFSGWTLRGIRLDPRVRARLRRATIAAASVAVVAGTLALPLAAAYQEGAGLDRLDVVPDLALLGDAVLILGLQVVGLTTAVLVASRPRLAVSAAAVAVVAPALAGHSRTIEPVWLVGLTDALHLAAGATWLGGLLGLVVALPSLSGRARDGGLVLARFSEVGAGLLAVLAVTGVLMGSRILGAWAPLVQTSYGRLLLVKVGIALLVAAVAGWNRWRLLPRIGAGLGHAAQRGAVLAVGRVVRVEAGLLVVLLMVTGLLVNRSPREAPPEVAPVASRVEVGALGESKVLGTLTPARQGRNTVTVQIQGLDGEPVDGFSAPVVSIRSLASAIDLGTLPLTPTAVGTYSGEVVLPAPGTWEVQVSLRAAEFANPVTTVRFEVS